MNHTPLDNNRNLQLAALVKEIETSSEPVILSVAFAIDLFDEVGFDRWLSLHGYTFETVVHKKAGADKTDRAYYHISKAPQLQLDAEDYEL